MTELSAAKIALMSFLCIVAGFVDSIAGGGGLISLTSYYAIGLPPVYALGNNKFSSSFGTLFAMANYARKKEIIWPAALAGSVFAIIGSMIGSQLALRYAGRVFRMMMLFVLPLLTFLTLFRPDSRRKHRKAIVEVDPDGNMKHMNADGYIIIALISSAIGVYDGFFGPGTGMFYTLILSSLGMPMIYSCGVTKVINLASNVAAVATFMANHMIIYRLGIPCVVASVFGNLLGSEFAIRKDTRIIKPMLLLVIAMLYVRIIADLI